ncbi:MAG: FecR domain-containing protein [Alphaproteobacteria bacterium]
MPGKLVTVLSCSGGCPSSRMLRPRALGLTIAIVLLAGLIFRPATAQDAAVGIVVKISGTAVALRDGATVALGLGDPIFVGDRVETAADGALGITLMDNSLLSLGVSSVFELTTFVLDPVTESFALGGRIVTGTIAVTTGEIGDIAPENVEFETPYGMIGIRGTRFAVTVI